MPLVRGQREEDVFLDAERGQELPQYGGDRPAGRAPDDLTDQHAERLRVVVIFVPGSHQGCAAARRSACLGSVFRVVSGGSAGRPTECVSTCRSVALSLQCAPNSGQISAIGRS
jgi:hypothetical protein